MFDWGYRYIQRLRTFEWELSDPSLGNFFRDKISSDLGAKAVEHFCLGIQRLLEPYSFDRFQVNFFRDYLYAKVYYFTVLARTARFSEISSIVISDIEGGLSAVLATLAKYTGTNLTIASHSLEVNQNFASSDFSEIRAFPARGDSKRFAITKRCRDFAKHSAIAWAKLRDQHLAKSASHSTARLNILMVLNELWDHNYYPAERLELFRFLEFMAKISVESDSNLAIRLKPNPYGRYFVDNFYQNISAYIDETAVLTDLISAADLIIGVGEVSSVLGFPSASAKIVFAVGSKGLDYEPSDSAKLIHANDIIFYGYEEFKGLITQVLGTY
jgi:hypothetical protein